MHYPCDVCRPQKIKKNTEINSDEPMVKTVQNIVPDSVPGIPGYPGGTIPAPGGFPSSLPGGFPVTPVPVPDNIPTPPMTQPMPMPMPAPISPPPTLPMPMHLPGPSSPAVPAPAPATPGVTAPSIPSSPSGLPPGQVPIGYPFIPEQQQPQGTTSSHTHENTTPAPGQTAPGSTNRFPQGSGASSALAGFQTMSDGNVINLSGLPLLVTPVPPEMGPETMAPGLLPMVTPPPPNFAVPSNPLLPSEYKEVITYDNLQYMNSFLRTQIGKPCSVEFLVGTGGLASRIGFLIGVGINYILLQDSCSGEILVCDFFSVRFVRFFGRYCDPVLTLSANEF